MRRIEVNPGEIFAVSDKVILLREFESVFAMTGKFATGPDQLTYALTFSGKLNNRPTTTDVTVLIAPDDLVTMVETMVGQLEWLNEVSAQARERLGE